MKIQQISIEELFRYCVRHKANEEYNQIRKSKIAAPDSTSHKTA